MFYVTCAIIEHHNKILICQRSKRMKLPLKWEFPGGKVEIGESKEDCLKREIQEELGLEVEIGSALTMVEHNDPEFSLCLYPFLCKWTGVRLQQWYSSIFIFQNFRIGNLTN